MAKKFILPAIHESELDVEKRVPPLITWIKSHMLAVYVGIAAVLIVSLFFGIRFYRNATHPISKFMSASAKDFNSSFQFEAEATKNGETVMKYTGSYEAKPIPAQSVPRVNPASAAVCTSANGVCATAAKRC